MVAFIDAHYFAITSVGYNSKSLENMNDSDDMDVDLSPMSSKSIKSGIERMLELGRELLQMSLLLEKKYQNVNDDIIAQNRKMMEVRIESFTLLNRHADIILTISGGI